MKNPLHYQLISLSGIFDASFFFHPYMELYRTSQIILCVGQGTWEGGFAGGNAGDGPLLQERGIPAWADYWGFDVSHDWCWWRKQLPYFFGHLDING